MTTFSLLLALAAAIGLLWLALEGEGGPGRLARDPAGRVDQALVVLALALAGSRLGYVSAHAAYFSAHLLEAFQPWLGGLSAPGALLGGLAGALLAGALGRVSPLRLADRVVRLAALLAAAAWLGAWQMGSAYGRLADGWWALPALDEWGRTAARLPVQVAGALFALGWMAFLDRQAPPGRVPAGLRSGAWLLGMGLALAALSFLRADPAPLWRGLRPDAWGALAVVLAGLLWLGASLVAHQK